MRKMGKKGRKDVITFALVYPDGHGNKIQEIFQEIFSNMDTALGGP